MNHPRCAIRSTLFGPALAALLASACQDGSPETGTVCPACDPRVGGETGDFGGTIAGVCGAVARRTTIDAAQASALGFDTAEIERRIARPIDASVRWVASADDGGSAPTGFEHESRVRADIAITEYGHNRPDPAFCDGTVCTFNGSTELQATCNGDQFLDLTVRVDFETADGAVRGTAVGQAVQWVADPRGVRNPALPVQVNTYVSLHDVTGSLRLYPELGHEPYRGRLDFSAELFADSYTGSVFPSVHYDTPGRTVWYTPLVGYFPSISPAAGGGGNAEVDAENAAGKRRDEQGPDAGRAGGAGP